MHPEIHPNEPWPPPKRQTKIFGQSETWNGQNLSEITTQVLSILKDMDFCFMEIREFGAPSECGVLVMDQIADDLQNVFTASGLDPKEWYETLKFRTTSKFAYESGLIQVLQILEV